MCDVLSGGPGMCDKVWQREGWSKLAKNSVTYFMDGPNNQDRSINFWNDEQDILEAEIFLREILKKKTRWNMRDVDRPTTNFQ